MSWPEPVPACSREEWAAMTDGAAWPGPPSSSPPRPLPWVQRGADGEVEYEIIQDEIVHDDETEGMDTVLGFLLPASRPGEVDDSSASSEQVS